MIQPVQLKKIKENPISYKLRDIPIKQITIWEEAQARTLDTAGIDSLARSIQQEGLQNPLMVQKDGSEYLLMAGQRRLEALKRLGAKTAPSLVLDQDSACEIVDAKAVSIIENIHRKDMSAYEMASSCQFLAEKLGKAAAAKALGINSSTLREYLGFGAVPEKVREMVPGIISKRDAIRICRVIPSESRAAEIIEKMTNYGSAQKKRYVSALEQIGANAEHSEIAKLANSFRARQNISLKVSNGQARGLAKLSRDSEMEPAEFAQKIVTEYLSRKGY